MWVAHLLTTTAVVEAATGICLIVVPNSVADLLFAEPLAGLGLGRIAGVALFALGVAAWHDRLSKIGTLNKGLDGAKIDGWTVVSMKEDWKTIFAPESK
ncbi:hypothetical protein LJR231_002684 [Phyllobacterium sp. LjRoot231]|uniref:hypothetical protein n=1 Tax=Phyllobacterium sp. LjRoot231 TaxID=3342289 RepID=UPI003ECDBE16